MFIFRLPDIGEGVAEGEVVKWNVAEGDTIESDQEMVEIMTDKVTVQIPSPVKGKVASIVVKEGSVAKVGDVLIEIDDGKQEESSNIGAVSEGPAETAPQPSAQSARTEPRSDRKILATPAIRKLAKDLNVDLEQVTPSGPGGRILPEDVRNFGKSKPSPKKEKEPESVHPDKKERAPPASPEDEVLEPKGLRRIIFDKMSKAKQIMPHFTIMEVVDISKVIEVRDDLRSQNVTIGFTPFFVKASAMVLKEFPRFNAVYDEANKRYILKKNYNIGFAVDTKSGLTVAVVKKADGKSIKFLAEEISDLAERARNNELKLAEVQDSTFTVSNVGSIGGILSTPIINYPEVAILGVHKPLDDAIAGGKNKMMISLSCDHRIIDGADAARFIVRLKEVLEKPSILLVDS